MAEKSDSRDSDGSWVLAGCEGLPVVTVGPEQDLESHGAEDEEPEEEDEEEGPQDTVTATAATGAAAFPGQAQHPESSGLGDLEECWDTGAGAVPTSDVSAKPSVPDGDEQEEPDAAAEPGPCPDTPKAGPPTEEGSCTSSDDDVEGLRRRQGHEPRPSAPRPTPTPRWVTPDAGAEDGLSMSKYLLGALALVAVGLLIVSGGIYDLADGPVESVLSRDAVAGEQESPLPTDGSDQQQRPPMLDARDPQSVESMSLLLDKLAKENQEIRLMQAELQAHKEELHALLQKSEGEAAAAGAQQQSLAAENARLRAALEREAAALRDTRAELQRLRATGAPGTPGAGQPAAEQPPGASAAARGEDAVRREGAWQHGWLGLVRQELAGALERARGPRGLEGLVEELSALEQRLGWELEAEEAEPFPRPWKKPFKAEKEKRHKQHGARGAPHERQRREQSKPHRHGKDPRPHREHKPDKAWGKSSRGPPQHGPRQLPPLSRYRAPQGCSGVADCARKEGREVLGAVLEPVQKTQFLQLLEGFMGRLGLGGHFGGLAARLDGAFGADGTFAHDRLRFVDFVDDVEELLEEVARRERGDEEVADGFEEYVLRHYTGESGTGGKERGRRATWQRRAAGLGPDVCTVLRLSGPLKEQYAKEHGLDFQRLLDASAYKEMYRQDMIRWGEEKRRADPGFFCRTVVEGAAQPVWVVSDTRRLSDVEWFRDVYGDVVQTVRVVATEETRKRRNWAFVTGVDDAESECGLDQGVAFDWVITNDGDELSLDEQLETLLRSLRAQL